MVVTDGLGHRDQLLQMHKHNQLNYKDSLLREYRKI